MDLSSAKIKRSELYQIFKDNKPSRNKPPILDEVVKEVSILMNVNITQDLTDILKRERKSFIKHMKNQWSKPIDARNVEDVYVLDRKDFDQRYFYTDDYMDSNNSRKSFLDIGVRMRKIKTEEIYNHIQRYVETELPDINFNQFIGYLLYRHNTQDNKDLAKIGMDIFKNNYKSVQTLNIDDAIALMHSLTLTKEQMRKLRYLLISRGIVFPTTNQLLEARKKLKPTISPVLDGKGVAVDYKTIVIETTEAILNISETTSTFTHEEDDRFLMIFKDGADGAGQQVVWKSTSMLGWAGNMFQYSIVPLKFVCTKHTGEKIILWENSRPNSAKCLRPIYLVREIETNEELLNLVIPMTDKARDELNEYGICTNFSNKPIKVNLEIIDSMKDLKFKKLLSGLGGADCILCVTKVNDWTNIENILQGFPINRSAEDTLLLYNELIDTDGNIQTSSGDFTVRKGLTKKPKTTSSQMSITLTHSYINGANWLLKLLYRCHAKYHRWELKARMFDKVEKSRKRVKSIIMKNTGLNLDGVCRAGAKGGTSSDGPQGRRLFSEELIETFKEILNNEHKDNFLKLHEQLSVILRIISCSHAINIPLFDRLCKDTSIHIATYFPWAHLNHTLHGSIQHSSELIAKNNGYGIGAFSEECLESNNKDIRNGLQFYSRKTSPIDQMTDVMSRQLERSHPSIVKKIEEIFLRKVVCIECGSNDHTIRSHANRTNLPQKHFDSLVKEYLLF